jgi:MscS family membrane protein
MTTTARRTARTAAAATSITSITPLPTLAAEQAGAEPISAVSKLLEGLLPEALFGYELLGIELWQWLCLLVLALVAAVLSWVLAVAMVRGLRPLLARTDTGLDDELLASAAGPLRLALAVAVFRVGAAPLDLGERATATLSSALSVLLIAAVAWLLVRGTDAFADRAKRLFRERDQTDAITLVPPARKSVKAVIVALALVAALDAFGFNVTALVAGLGVGGIAVALAAQKTVENLFGGFSLYADRPVRVGDFCRFGDTVGNVEEIGLRSTRVRTLARSIVTVPNSQFATLQLENYALRDGILFEATLGLRYETSAEQLRHVLVEVRKLLYAHERVKRDPARARLVGFGAYSLDLEVFAYVDTTDYNEFLGIREDLMLRIMDIVEASGTGFAFPSQTLYLGKDGGLPAEAGERAAKQVAKWREKRELYLPEFPRETIDEIENTVRFPAEGSPA